MSFRLGSFRSGGIALVLALAVVTLPGTRQNASAQSTNFEPFPSLSCPPLARVFSTTWSAWIIDEWKKMSRQEFGMLPISPSGVATLPAGAELNVVIDMKCLLDPNKGPLKLAWLHQVKDELLPSSGASMRSVNWTLETDWNFDELQQAFEEEPCVHLVSPEGRFFPVARRLNDPMLRNQAHLPALKFNEAYRAFSEALMVRNPVTIAVVDTGVDFAHPDLALNKWVNQAEVPGNFIDDDRNGYVDDVSGYNFAGGNADPGPQGDWPENKHGSHVAGLAAARLDNREGGVGIHGVAKVMSLNVFGVNNFTRSSVLENAIRYAADQKAEVINLSLGGREYSRSMRSALEYAISRGSFLVTAAGNEGIELCDNPGSFNFISPAVYGSSIEGMLVTASTDVISRRLSRFSNFGNRLVEIAAPGAYTSEGQLIGLLSTVPTGDYAYVAGTSMAAPVLSGAAALAITWLKAYGYEWNPRLLERILRESARKDPFLALQVQDGRSLDLLELARYLQANYPPRTQRPVNHTRPSEPLL